MLETEPDDAKRGLLELLKNLFSFSDDDAEGKMLSNQGLEKRGKGIATSYGQDLGTIFANNPWMGNAKKPTPEEMMFMEAMRKDFEEKQMMKMMLERQQASQVQNQFNPGVLPRRF